MMNRILPILVFFWGISILSFAQLDISYTLDSGLWLNSKLSNLSDEEIRVQRTRIKARRDGNIIRVYSDYSRNENECNADSIRKKLQQEKPYKPFMPDDQEEWLSRNLHYLIPDWDWVSLEPMKLVIETDMHYLLCSSNELKRIERTDTLDIGVLAIPFRLKPMQVTVKYYFDFKNHNFRFQIVNQSGQKMQFFLCAEVVICGFSTPRGPQVFISMWDSDRKPVTSDFMPMYIFDKSLEPQRFKTLLPNESLSIKIDPWFGPNKKVEERIQKGQEITCKISLISVRSYFWESQQYVQWTNEDTLKITPQNYEKPIILEKVLVAPYEDIY